MESFEGKGFGELFGNINLDEKYKKIIDAAKVNKINLYKKSGSIEIHASSDIYIPFRDLKVIEKNLGKFFGNFDVFLNIKYNQSSTVEEIVREYSADLLCFVNRQMPLSIGIMHDAIIKAGNKGIEIILGCQGAEILKAKRCHKLIERTILDMFGIETKVSIKDGKNVECKITKGESDVSKMYGFEYDVPTISQQVAAAMSSSDSKDGNRAASPPTQGPKSNTNTYANNSGQKAEGYKNKGGFTRRGESKDETSNNPNCLLGRMISDSLVKVNTISLDSGSISFKGDVIKVETRDIMGGEKVLVSFDLTDYSSSVTVKFFCKKDKFDEIKDKIKEDVVLVVRGEAQYDKFTKELSVMANDINLSSKEEKKDNAQRKRVELHLHTQMSSMDGVSSTKSLVKRAAQWGHPAVAITDHGVVQAFPDAMEAGAKNKIKIIYGVEAYLLDDALAAVLVQGDMPLDGSFVVFDVETTGLSPRKDRIIEIGAVKVVGAEIVDRFSSFINPEMPIPPFITELTGISDATVAEAPLLKEVLEGFLNFCSGSVVVAHNASFDTAFIRTSARKIEAKFENPVVDTLVLSRKMLTNLKKHKLDIVAKHFGVSLENHHRAIDDAKATAQIFLKFIELLKEKGADNISNIDKTISGVEDYTKMKPYHAVILVKNYIGLKNLYRIISESHLNYFFKKPRVPKKLFEQYREGLIIGTACEAGELYQAILQKKSNEDIEKTAKFYDYLEIQPLLNNQFLIENGTVSDMDELKDISKTIVNLGKKLDKPVVATCDVHFMDPGDEVFRRILMAGQGFSDADNQAPLYFRTTEEMLQEFSYLGDSDCYDVVIENTNKVADMIDSIIPIPDGTFPPKIDGSEEEIRKLAEGKAKEVYGENLPEVVLKRLEKELNSIIKNGFSVMYIIAQKLVWKSVEDGYLVGSRGSVGSSFVANMTGITEVNSLPPHYICTKCRYSEFIEDGSIGCGFDLPDKDCPSCGYILKKDGYDIPFETFLGFDGDKEPDIDLNFSGEYQSTAHKYTEELFGVGYVYRAGTIGTIAEKTAFGYVKNYMDEKQMISTNAEMGRLIKGCSGVKRTTGQHPGGVMIVPNYTDIYEFCPIQRPADDNSSSIITTHFDYHSISGRLLKLDILGHDDPTVIKMLEDLTGIDATSILIGEKETMGIFSSTTALGVSPQDINSEVGTFAIPEFGTKFVRQMLVDTRPTTFSELIRISGLSHGTDVWLNNAQELIRANTATLSEVICTRDDIMLYLIYAGLPPKTAFKIMEDVRKGKGLKEEYIEIMKEKKVPQWYIESCQKIKYMFPKAHAAAYVMMAFRIAWFKVHHPEAFYVAYYTVRADDFDGKLMANGQEKLRRHIREYEQKGNEITQKDKNVLTIMEVVNEMYARGIKFLPVDLYESESVQFRNTPLGIRLPFNALGGLGVNAAKSIVEARKSGKFISIDDIRQKAKISKSVIEILREAGSLAGMPESNQISIFEYNSQILEIN